MNTGVPCSGISSELSCVDGAGGRTLGDGVKGKGGVRRVHTLGDRVKGEGGVRRGHTLGDRIKREGRVASTSCCGCAGMGNDNFLFTHRYDSNAGLSTGVTDNDTWESRHSNTSTSSGCSWIVSNNSFAVANAEALVGSSPSFCSELLMRASATEELKFSNGDFGRGDSDASKGFVETSCVGLSNTNSTGEGDENSLVGTAVYNFSSSDRGGGRGGLSVTAGFSSSSNFSQLLSTGGGGRSLAILLDDAVDTEAEERESRFAFGKTSTTSVEGPTHIDKKPI